VTVKGCHTPPATEHVYRRAAVTSHVCDVTSSKYFRLYGHKKPVRKHKLARSTTIVL